MAETNSPSSAASLTGDESSSYSRLESSASFASITQNLQRTVLQSTDSAIRSARSLKHNSSTRIRSRLRHSPMWENGCQKRSTRQHLCEANTSHGARDFGFKWHLALGANVSAFNYTANPLNPQNP
ncbi:chromosome-associated kinesin [Senna tora]|uniref:Chromosome-associated kinesin n=1 Tax=Senna tora TaxID=362788 RepID=A0A834X2Q2_9FABA|nr:chromosome-associated kinesin [Senna tora]